MTTRELMKFNIEFTHGITQTYLNDVTDDDLLVRPVPNANHLAWQLGHLISSEHALLSGIGADVPALPDGFAECHSKEAAGSDDPAKFNKKSEYLALMTKMHDAAGRMIDSIPEARLDEPAPEAVRSYLPTVGSVLLMAGSHEMMHVGQFATIRRALGKPVVI